MIVTALEGGFRKKGPRMAIQYRDNGNYSAVDFRSSIINNVIPYSTINRDYDGLDSAIKAH